MAEEATRAGQMPQAALAALRDVGLVSLAGSWNRRGSTEMVVIIGGGTEKIDHKHPPGGNPDESIRGSYIRVIS